MQVGHIPIWRPGPMEWVTQLLQVTSSQDPNSIHKDPISKRGPMLGSQVTPFGKVTIPLSSMGLDHIPIWRLGPMKWVTQLVQDPKSHLQRPYFPMRSHVLVYKNPESPLPFHHGGHREKAPLSPTRVSGSSLRQPILGVTLG
jgi:hypothetical protein